MKEINDLDQIPGYFPWEPMFNKVIITLNTETPDNNLILSDNTMSDTQYIVAKGSYVNNLEIGDKVLIDLEKMIVQEYNPNNTHEKISRIKIEPIEFEDKAYAIIEDRFIKAKYKG